MKKVSCIGPSQLHAFLMLLGAASVGSSAAIAESISVRSKDTTFPIILADSGRESGSNAIAEPTQLAQQGVLCHDPVVLRVHSSQFDRFYDDCFANGGTPGTPRASGSSGGPISDSICTRRISPYSMRACNVALTGDYSQPARRNTATIGGGPAGTSLRQSPATVAPRPAPAQPNPARGESDSARARLASEMRSQPNPFASLVGAAGTGDIPVTTAPDDRTKLESALCRGVADCDARLSSIPAACRKIFRIIGAYDEGLVAGPSALVVRALGPAGFSIQTAAGVALDLRMPDDSLVRIGENSSYEVADCTKPLDSGDGMITRLEKGLLRMLVRRPSSSNAKFKIEYNSSAGGGVRG